jgi:hypothetical protein
MRKTPGRLLVAVCALAATGCYDRTQWGTDSVYTYQLWVPLAVVAGSLAFSAIGVFMVRGRNRLRGILVIVAGMMGLAVGCPATVLERVVIGPDRLYVHTGQWSLPNPHEFQLAEVARLDVEVEVRDTRSGPQNSYYAKVQLKSGQRDRFPVSSLMKRAFPEILDRLNERNITAKVPPDALNE